MPFYVVAQLNIHDRTRYARYESGFMEIFSKYGGSVLSVDEAAKVLEGDVELHAHGPSRVPIGRTGDGVVSLAGISEPRAAPVCCFGCEHRSDQGRVSA